MGRLCKQCGVDYNPKKKSSLYCSKRCSKMGSNNPMWKVDVGYAALHEWVKNNKPKLYCCEVCGQQKNLDLASINHTYTRNVIDWQWLCRKCHYEKDERHITFLANTRSRRLANIKCRNCGKDFKPNNSQRKYCSKSCSCTYINLNQRVYN